MFCCRSLSNRFYSLPLAGLFFCFHRFSLFLFSLLGFSLCFTFTGFLALTAAPAGLTKALLGFVATCSATSELGVDTMDCPATVTVPPLRDAEPERNLVVMVQTCQFTQPCNTARSSPV